MVLEKQNTRLSDLNNLLNKLNIEKLDVSSFNRERNRLDNVIKELTEQAENHGNHFAMVENFVEKYIPIRI